MAMTRKGRKPARPSITKNNVAIKQEETKSNMTKTNDSGATNHDPKDETMSEQGDKTQPTDNNHIKMIKTAAPKKTIKEPVAVIKPVLEPIFIFMD